jgi:hypothetical protein
MLYHRVLYIVLTTPRAYAAVAFDVGQYEKPLRYGKLATGYMIKMSPSDARRWNGSLTMSDNFATLPRGMRN